MLLASMNPCPCGFLGDISRQCTCSPEQVRRYRARVSGPLLDRIDLHVEVPRVPHETLRGESREESSAAVRERIIAARELQYMRADKTNADLSNKEMELFCKIVEADETLLGQAIERLKLSPRAYHRIIKVARTIADLAASEAIQTPHLLEAIGYRALDRGNS